MSPRRVSPSPAEAHVLAAPLRVGVLWDDRGLDRDVRYALSGDGLVLVSQGQSLEDVLRESVALDVVLVIVHRLGARQHSVLRQLRTALPAAAVVVVSDVLKRRDLQEAERAGADGLVLRSRAGSTLPAAVRAVCTGQLVVPRDLAGQIARPVLTVRERQVLGMVVLGCTNGEIARRLYIAETTVKSHLSTAFAKLGVGSRSEAVAAILDPDRGLGTGILAISEGEVASPRGRSRVRVEPESTIPASEGSQ